MGIVLFDLLKKMWWLIFVIPLAVLLLWRSHELHNAQAQLAKCKAAQAQVLSDLQAQNAAIARWQEAAREAQAKATALAAQRQQARTQVEVQWKTRLVQVPIPTTCASAVAVSATNAANIGRLFETTP